MSPFTLTLAVLLAAAGDAPPTTDATGAPRALLSLSAPNLQASSRRALRLDIVHGLRSAGLEARAEDDDSDPDRVRDETFGACSDASCIRRVGAETHVAYLVKATVSAVNGPNSGKRTYAVELEVFAADTGTSVQKKQTACDACDEDLATHLAYLLAADVGRQVVTDARRRDRPSPPSSPTIAIAASPPSVLAPAPPKPPAVSLPVGPSDTPTSGPSHWLGWTLVGGGLVAGGASAVLFAINGNKINCSSLQGDPDPCTAQRTTLLPGIVTGVLAVAAIGGGIIILRDRMREPRLALSVQPFGFGIGGRL